MDLRHVRAFVAVYEEGGISAAARRLRTAQPSISVLIRDLEAELDRTLFMREARGVAPTPAADALFPHYRDVIGSLERGHSLLSEQNAEVAGALNIGLAPTITKGILPGLLQDFVATYPRVDIRIAEAFSGTLIDWTLSGEVDFAVVTVPAKDRRLATRALAGQPVVLVAGSGSGRQPLEPARLDAGPKLKLVLPSARHSLRHLIDWQIGSGAIPVSRSIEIDGLSGILEFVRRSDWVSLLPVSAVLDEVTDGSGLVAQPVGEALPDIEFYLLHRLHLTLPRAATLFIEDVERRLLESVRSWDAVLEGSLTDRT